MMPVAACIPAAAGITTLLTASVLRSSGYVGASLSMTYTGAEHVFKSGYTCCCIPAGELLSRKRRHRVVRGPDAGTRPRAGGVLFQQRPRGPESRLQKLGAVNDVTPHYNSSRSASSRGASCLGGSRGEHQREWHTDRMSGAVGVRSTLQPRQKKSCVPGTI